MFHNVLTPTFLLYASCLLLLQLGEKLLSMTPDLHGCFGPDVLCKSPKHLSISQKGLGATQLETFEGWPRWKRTFYSAPSPPIEPESLQKSQVLLISPLLPLLGYGIGLTCLQNAHASFCWG